MSILIKIISAALVVVILAVAGTLFVVGLDFANTSDAVKQFQDHWSFDWGSGNEKPVTPAPGGNESTPGTDPVQPGGKPENPDHPSSPNDPEPEIPALKIKESIKTLVESYNSANKELLIESFQSYTQNIVEQDDKQNAVVATVMNVYVENLFGSIEAITDADSPEEVIQQFSEEEAEVLETYVTFVNNLVTEDGNTRVPEPEEVVQMIDAASTSEVGYTTIVQITQDEEVLEACASAVQNMNTEDRAALEESIRSYEDQEALSDRQMEVYLNTLLLLGFGK